jgi:dihydrofolate reductase
LSDPQWVDGSGDLFQTLLKNDLIDRLHIWSFPVTVGGGKRLFAEGARPIGYTLLDCKSSTTGVTIATYVSTGTLHTGSLAGSD